MKKEDVTTIGVVQGARFRVRASTQPHVGVVVEIMYPTPDGGERPLPPFWLSVETARGLAKALTDKVGIARSAH